jgi:hypothetical protein
MPEKAVGGNPIVHLEVRTREHARGEELAGTEGRRRLEGRLRQGRSGADPKICPQRGHPGEGYPDHSRHACHACHHRTLRFGA